MKPSHSNPKDPNPVPVIVITSGAWLVESDYMLESNRDGPANHIGSDVSATYRVMTKAKKIEINANDLKGRSS